MLTTASAAANPSAGGKCGYCGGWLDGLAAGCGFTMVVGRAAAAAADGLSASTAAAAADGFCGLRLSASVATAAAGGRCGSAVVPVDAGGSCCGWG